MVPWQIFLSHVRSRLKRFELDEVGCPPAYCAALSART